MATLRPLAVLLLVFTSIVVGCSSNAAATAKCNASASRQECITCCRSNGASGHSWTGAGSCKCLN